MVIWFGYYPHFISVRRREDIITSISSLIRSALLVPRLQDAYQSQPTTALALSKLEDAQVCAWYKMLDWTNWSRERLVWKVPTRGPVWLQYWSCRPAPACNTTMLSRKPLSSRSEANELSSNCRVPLTSVPSESLREQGSAFHNGRNGTISHARLFIAFWWGSLHPRYCHSLTFEPLRAWDIIRPVCICRFLWCPGRPLAEVWAFLTEGWRTSFRLHR